MDPDPRYPPFANPNPNTRQTDTEVALLVLTQAVERLIAAVDRNTAAIEADRNARAAGR